MRLDLQSGQDSGADADLDAFSEGNPATQASRRADSDEIRDSTFVADDRSVVEDAMTPDLGGSPDDSSCEDLGTWRERDAGWDGSAGVDEGRESHRAKQTQSGSDLGPPG